MTTYYPATPKTHEQHSGFDRVKVDQGQTNFFLGRQFRMFRELSIPTGTTEVIKLVVTVPVILTSADISLDAGWLRIAPVVGGTEGGAFSTGITVFNSNNMPVGKDKFENYLATVTASVGGTHTGGTELDVNRIKVAGNSNFVNTVKGSDDLPRGVSPGTYYYRLTNLDPGTTTGVFRLSWEDRPQGG